MIYVSIQREHSYAFVLAQVLVWALMALVVMVIMKVVRCNDIMRLNDCTDINECETDGRCAQTCTNTEGSFQCSCSTGFTLAGDGSNCNGNYLSFYNYYASYIVFIIFFYEDINECLSNNGGCSEICDNTDGSFQCSCNMGSTLADDGFSCIPDGMDLCITINQLLTLQI